MLQLLPWKRQKCWIVQCNCIDSLSTNVVFSLLKTAGMLLLQLGLARIINDFIIVANHCLLSHPTHRKNTIGVSRLAWHGRKWLNSPVRKALTHHPTGNAGRWSAPSKGFLSSAMIEIQTQQPVLVDEDICNLAASCMLGPDSEIHFIKPQAKSSQCYK